jgi:hypothetical protein
MSGGCEVKPFPLAQRVGKIRRVAEIYGRKSGKDATGYWRQQITNLGESLAAVGVSPDEVERQLVAFKEAVQSEMARRKDESGAA